MAVRISGAESRAHSGPRAGRLAREAEYAARWREGAWLDQTLTTLDGACYTLRYQGRPGTGTGPDFRDAVLLADDGGRICGDVELHLRPRNWQAHGHDRDRRYNNVALHVVIAPGGFSERATRRQDGEFAPITVLPDADTTARHATRWPCGSLGERSNHQALSALLRSLGEARLHERAAALSAAMETQPPLRTNDLNWSNADITLWLALAEALGYGRDCEAMRDAGWRLLSRSHSREERGYGGEARPRLDTRRLEGLSRWLSRWRDTGPWRETELWLREDDTRAGSPSPRGSGGQAVRPNRLSAARAAGSGGAISPGRAAIVVVNVVLPFALAMAERTDDMTLERRVRAVYAGMPGLPSNTITRVLGRQFGLARLPSGAQAQQGLHHVWAHWCREKRCERCPLASLASGITIAARAGS